MFAKNIRLKQAGYSCYYFIFANAQKIVNYSHKDVYEKEYQESIRRLKQARIDAGLSQQAVAERMGKPQSYVSKIESGERRLDVAEMKKFAEIYKRQTSFLSNIMVGKK
jgi:ribosome-binding protein aMBF1 (putative translation factor)